MQSISKAELGSAVRRLRIACGYRQETMAAKMGYSRSSYSYKELGKSWFTVNDLVQISNILELPVEIFFYPERYPGPLDRLRVREKAKRR